MTFKRKVYKDTIICMSKLYLLFILENFRVLIKFYTPLHNLIFARKSGATSIRYFALQPAATE